MKSYKVLVLTVLIVALFSLTACNTSTMEEETSETIIYASETGDIEVPANPERIVVLNSFVSGAVMHFDDDIVGIDAWSNGNERYHPYLEGAVEVSEENIEKILELDPDLIVAASTTNNLDKFSEIAPTVTYTYAKVDYLTQILEIGKLLNKEEEANEWIDSFKGKASEAGEKIKDQLGEDITITVAESFEKQLYVFGDNWGRGTEILYQEMGLAMPEKVEEMALEAGYHAISPEVLSDYVGDYLVLSKSSAADHSFQETELYQGIDAVQNEKVLEVEARKFYFNGPITLDYQLDIFIDFLLGDS